jgi:type IV pilus assembly protein PilQ
MVDDGETIVIGGIVKNTDRDSKEGLPWLATIPGLGWLFGRDTKIRSKEELLLFITPKIVQLEQKDVAKLDRG